MTEQHDPSQTEDRPKNETITPSVKAYIDQQVENAVKHYDESQPKRKKLRNSWRSASPITKMGVYLSAVAVAATMTLAILAWRQLDAMKTIASSNTQQTQQLLDAANQMKAAAWTFSGASIGTNNAVWGAVGRLDIQAKATRDLAESTRILNRPYMAAITAGDGFEVDGANQLITFTLYTQNFGSIPAINVRTKVRAYRNGWNEMPVFYTPSIIGPATFMPGQVKSSQLKFGRENYREIQLPDTSVMLCVSISYDDEKHPKPYAVSQELVYGTGWPPRTRGWGDAGECPEMFR